MMMAARLSTLQRLIIVMAGAAAADGSNKLDPFVVTSCHGPLTTLLSTFDMLQDAERNQAYNKAIRLAINATAFEGGDKTIFRCLDIGTGSGLLTGLVASALSSSKLRAEIYACEGVEEVAEVAARTFSRNELDVRLLRGRSTEVDVSGDLPYRVPFVVSELLGTGLLDEGIIPTMRDAKNRFLQPGFVSIPSSAEVYAFLCESEELLQMTRLWENTVGGLRAPSAVNWKHCPGSAAPASTHVKESGGQRCIRFPVDVSGSVHALVCWWRCFLDRDRTIVMSTSPGEPCRDHWRQSVYVVPSVGSVEMGDVVQMFARHDDNMIWFDADTREKGEPSRSKTGLRVENSSRGDDPMVTTVAAATPVAATEISGTAGGKSSTEILDAQQAVSTDVQESSSRSSPVCLCGLHVTCSPRRIWMYNDKSRTTAFRSVISKILNRHITRELDGPNVAEVAGLGNRRVVCACVSDGFLLQLLAAQEGASDILEIPTSVTFEGVCREVYRANGIGEGIIRRLPGGVTSFLDLLSPLPGSPDLFHQVGKIDAVLGEPFFWDLSRVWPFESMLQFWCVRTALEAGGCFSPRTRVLPARSRLLARAFASELLWRARRRVEIVEGVDMSAVNEAFGCNRAAVNPGETGALPLGRDDGNGSSEEDVHIESIVLGEYPYVLLGPSAVVLDMDLTGPLCDLYGGRTELTCSLENTEAEGRGAGAVCHGILLWLDIWLDEEGCYRLSTGPEVPYWPQGLLFFDKAWSVPPCGRSFYVGAMLEDGTLKVAIS